MKKSKKNWKTKSWISRRINVCHRSYHKRKEKNYKLQEELDKKNDTRELEQMIKKLKVQIEEYKWIDEALKEKLEEKNQIIENLEA